MFDDRERASREGAARPFGANASRAWETLEQFAFDTANDVGRALRENANAMSSFTRDRVVMFLALSVGALAMFALACATAGASALAPAKFGLCFTASSALSIAAIGALRGWQAQLAHMASEGRLGATLMMTFAMMMTVREAVAKHSYIGTLFWSVAQVLAVGYYHVNNFPYGAQGAKAVANVAISLGGPAVGACASGVGAMWNAAYGGGSSASNASPV